MKGNGWSKDLFGTQWVPQWDSSVRRKLEQERCVWFEIGDLKLYQDDLSYTLHHTSGDFIN